MKKFLPMILIAVCILFLFTGCAKKQDGWYDEDSFRYTISISNYTYVSNTSTVYAYLTNNMSSTRMERIDTIASSALIANKSAIKSVQRGSSTMVLDTSSTAITISAVTPSKCTVNVFGAGYKTGRLYSSTYMESSVYVSSLSSNSLTVGTNVSEGSSTYSGRFSWEVVEYY